MLTFENRSLRDVASFAPYEFIEILTNSRTYGGGGIFNLYSTVAADSLWSPYVFVHEFGHHFAGPRRRVLHLRRGLRGGGRARRALGAQRDGPPRPEGISSGATSSNRALRCRPPGPRRPTRRSLARYQKKRRQIRAEKRPEEEMDALFIEQKRAESRFFAAEKYAGKVGAFEGAMYEAKGYYRPQIDCIMFSRDDVPFCAVCRRAIERVIDLLCGPGLEERKPQGGKRMSFARGLRLAGFARRHLGRMNRGRRDVMTHLADPRPENLPMPTFVQLRVTNLCNLRCKMCGQWGTPGSIAPTASRPPRPTARRRETASAS